jgi:hypothetical protein
MKAGIGVMLYSIVTAIPTSPQTIPSGRAKLGPIPPWIVGIIARVRMEFIANRVIILERRADIGSPKK